MNKHNYYKYASKDRRRKKEQEERLSKQKQERLNKQKQEKLTHKQELFCQYYLKNFNATLAYIKAYDCKNYNTANAEGYKFLVKPCIKKEIERLKEIKKQSIMLDKDDIVERYMRIAFADMTDFVDWGTYEKLVTNEIGEPILIENEQTGKEEYLKEKRNRVEFKDSNLVDGGLICQIKYGKDGATIKLEDRQKALEWLGKYFLMNPLDKHKIDFDKLKFEQGKQEHADKMTLEIEKIERGIGTEDDTPTTIIFTDNEDDE